MSFLPIPNFTLKIKNENLYKLNTKEDSSFLHKGLGGLILVHFFYRYCMYYWYGSMFFNSALDVFLINTHGILSISSFLFHIPNFRNRLKPMIYPEFRLHSILFAWRSILVCNIYYYDISPILIIFTCFGTMLGADIVTFYLNLDGKNGNTMRNMPFESQIDNDLQIEIIKMHSIMQIGATTFMLGNIDTAFSPLFAIQLAAFLMTMVRKSIITTTMWHAIYSLSLWINIGFFTTLSTEYLLIQLIIIYSFKKLFFPYRVNKYIAWSILFGIYSIYISNLGLQKFSFLIWLDSLYLIIYLKKLLVIAIWIHYFHKFKPLFLE